MTAEIESIQFVAFTDIVIATDASALWPHLFPHIRVMNFTTITPGHTAASAMLNGMQLEVQSQPGRIDLFATGQPSVVARPPALPSFDDALHLLRPAFDEVCRTVSPTRVACVANTREPVADESAAIAAVQRSLPIKLNPSSTDLNFQVNVRVNSAAQSGLEFNRLCRWSTGMMLMMQFVQGQVGTPPSGLVPSLQLHVANTYIDVNTHAGVALDQTKLSEIVDETVAETRAIIRSGYAHL